MSELTAFITRQGFDAYLKSEADKVIAEKDVKIAELKDKVREQTSIAEEGWKEAGTYHTSYAEAVKELYDKNKEIAELKKACNDKDDWCLHTLKENRHSNYKRCLAMAYVEWLKQMSLCNYPESILYRRAVRRERKWKELAEVFK